MFYLSAQTSIIGDGPNRTYHLKKRAEGFKHIQAVISVARRRVDVLWALLRDNRLVTNALRNKPTPHRNLTDDQAFLLVRATDDAVSSPWSSIDLWRSHFLRAGKVSQDVIERILRTAR